MRDDDKLNEVHERTRRIETRLTRFMESMGVDAGGKRPVWGHGSVVMPSMACSLHQIVTTIPTTWDRDKPVDIVMDGAVIGTITLQ